MLSRLTIIDFHLITFVRRWSIPLARLALFVIFAWFGSLKVFGLSPATPLVEALFNRTLWWMPFDIFYITFALYEVLIGISFLIPRFERLAMLLLIPHMIATSLPLFLVPEITWSSLFVPTLEGQYIIKNLVLIAAAVGIAASIAPLKDLESANDKDRRIQQNA